MKRISVLALAVFAALYSNSALAQTGERDRAPLGAVLDLWVAKTQQLVVPAADALPERSYGFVPTGRGFVGVRAFGDQVKHLAAANYQLAARAPGEEPPAGTRNETAPESVQTKAQIIEYLRRSFDALHRAAARVTVQNAEDPILVARETQSAAGLVVDAIAHAQNHYGQIVEYLRMNGIVPPASR